MSLRKQVLQALAIAVLAVGPAVTLPTLSAHQPTLVADTQNTPAPPATPFAPVPVGLGMAIKVKDATAAAKKFKDRASGASGDYATGVAGAAGDFEQKALAANDTYKQAVMDAASKDLYAKGVRGSGAKYLKNATGVGPTRYTQGIANAQDVYAASMAPVLQTIAGLNLPPRGVKGTNQDRSNIVAAALRKMKVGS